MELNSRTKAIIEHLLKSDTYVTYDELGQELNVSSRTISREIKEVEAWFLDKDIEIVKKPRKGIIVSASTPTKLSLLDELAMNTIYKIYTQKERLDFILLELIHDEEPIKQFYFASLLNVSEATISHDLDKLTPVLDDHALKLIRKPGVGIYLEGVESQKRQLLTSILYEYYDKEKLFTMTKQEIAQPTTKRIVVDQTKERLLNMVDKNTLIKLENIVNDASSDYDYPLTDISRVGLIVHLAISIQRIKQHEEIEIESSVLDSLKNSNEYKLSLQISNKVEKEFNVVIPESENGYITMHLKGARVKSFSNDKEYVFSNFELVRMTNHIIKCASERSGIDLSHDQQLLIGLITHLKPVLIRLKLHLTIRNPLLKDIKDRYPKYFELAIECQKFIENELDVSIPEEETAFLAMHIGSAVERQKGKQKRKIRVVVTCTTGIGSSKMLTARLNQEFDVFEIVDTISSLNLNKEDLEKRKIDLIISTIKNNDFPLPSIVVSPMLNTKDVDYIQNYISKLDFKTIDEELIVEKNVVSKVKSNIEIKDHKEFIRNTVKYSEHILKLVNNTKVYQLNTTNFKDFLYKYGLEYEDPKLAARVKQSLLKREKIGSTIIKEHGLMLLHSKCDGLTEMQVSIIKLDNGFVYKKYMIHSVIVLLVDSDADYEEIEIISQISKNLIEDKNFIEVIKNKSENDIVNYIEYIMSRFLRTFLTKGVK